MITVPTVEQLVATARDRVTAALSLNSGTPLGDPIEAMIAEYARELRVIYVAAAEAEALRSPAALADLVAAGGAPVGSVYAMAALVGTFRRPAGRTFADVIFTGAPGTRIPAGTRVATIAGGPLIEFDPPGGRPAEVASAPVATLLRTTGAVVLRPPDLGLDGSAQDLDAGMVVSDDVAGFVAASPGEGRLLLARASGPVEGGFPIDAYRRSDWLEQSVDAIRLSYVGDGTAYARASVEAADLGHSEIPSGALAVAAVVNATIGELSGVGSGIVRIVDPIIGLIDVMNPAEATPGTELESTIELIDRTIGSMGHGRPNQGGRAVEVVGDTDKASRSAATSTLLEIDGVTDAILYEMGRLPGDTLELEPGVVAEDQSRIFVVLGGSLAAIVDRILDVWGDGYLIYVPSGLAGETVSQSLADGRRYDIVRPVAVPIDLEIGIDVDPDVYVDDGGEAIRQAIETLSLTSPDRPVSRRLRIGQSVTALDLACEITDAEIPGVRAVYHIGEPLDPVGLSAEFPALATEYLIFSVGEVFLSEQFSPIQVNIDGPGIYVPSTSGQWSALGVPTPTAQWSTQIAVAGDLPLIVGSGADLALSGASMTVDIAIGGWASKAVQFGSGTSVARPSAAAAGESWAALFYAQTADSSDPIFDPFSGSGSADKARIQTNSAGLGTVLLRTTLETDTGSDGYPGTLRPFLLVADREEDVLHYLYTDLDSLELAPTAGPGEAVSGSILIGNPVSASPLYGPTIAWWQGADFERLRDAGLIDASLLTRLGWEIA